MTAVGKDHWQGSIDSLRPRGYMVNFGNASGPLPPIDAVELNVKGSLFFTKASMRFYHLNRAGAGGQRRDAVRGDCGGRQ